MEGANQIMLAKAQSFRSMVKTSNVTEKKIPWLISAPQSLLKVCETVRKQKIPRNVIWWTGQRQIPETPSELWKELSCVNESWTVAFVLCMLTDLCLLCLLILILTSLTIEIPVSFKNFLLPNNCLQSIKLNLTESTKTFKTSAMY